MSGRLNTSTFGRGLAGPLIALAGGAYLTMGLRDGWFPSDEGSLAVTAERVLMGGLPHRDFPDLYTGGLSFLNAAAFRALGTDLVSPRIVLLIAFVVWLIVFYRLCARFLPGWFSVLVLALVIVWSVPNYPAAMPSWYNLFLASGGLLAILAFSDSGRLRWLGVAGLCAGLSVAVKVVGVFFVLATLVFLLFHEQTSEGRSPPAKGSRAYTASTILFSFSVILSLVYLVSRVGGAAQIFRFVAPMSAVALVPVVEEWRRPRSAARFRSRCRSALVPAACFLAGTAIPLLVLSVPYVLSGAMTDLLEGVFIQPSRRLEYAAKPAPPILTAVFTLAVVGALALGQRIRLSLRWAHYLFLGLAGAGVLVSARWTWGAYMFVWLSAYNLTPIVVVTGCFWVAFTEASERHRQSIFALLSVTAAVAMAGFPFSAAVYFHYSAALAILTLTALLWQASAPNLSKVAVVIPWAFYFAFGVGLMNPQRPGAGGPHVAGQRWAELALPRARLRTSPADSMVYGQLVKIVGAHGDRTLGYAGPDSPEVYFLTGSRSSEPVLFDFLYSETGSPVDDPEFLKRTDLVVLNHQPGFSAPISPETMERLTDQFPHSEVAGHFEIRWRP